MAGNSSGREEIAFAGNAPCSRGALAGAEGDVLRILRSTLIFPTQTHVQGKTGQDAPAIGAVDSEFGLVDALLERLAGIIHAAIFIYRSGAGVAADAPGENGKERGGIGALRGTAARHIRGGEHARSRIARSHADICRMHGAAGEVVDHAQLGPASAEGEKVLAAGPTERFDQLVHGSIPALRVVEQNRGRNHGGENGAQIDAAQIVVNQRVAAAKVEVWIETEGGGLQAPAHLIAHG